MSALILEEYIETGNVQDLEMLLAKQPELLNTLTSQEVSPLLLACYYQKAPIIQTILKHTKSISVHEVCALGYDEQLELMLAQRPKVIDELSTNGFSTLGIASHFGKESAVRILLRNHANPNIPSQNGYDVYPIHAAMNANHTSTAKLLIEGGAEVNVIQQGGFSPLHFAAQHGNIDLIILLLENGIDIKILSAKGDSASEIAFQYGHQEIGKILSF
ncbi:ankyrin repeat domain-containing protein [Sphingobacterium corticis]|uniref:Ankyrin repeat domain-containing protein n=1 Tax=Sphingobacterium corticis TaxID=1812823 RepID=A0ABW5NLJ1_9SPHI